MSNYYCPECGKRVEACSHHPNKPTGIVSKAHYDAAMKTMQYKVDTLTAELAALRAADPAPPDPRKWSSIAPRYSIGRDEENSVLILDHHTHSVIAHSVEAEAEHVEEMLNRANGWLPDETHAVADPAPDNPCPICDVLDGHAKNCPQAVGAAPTWMPEWGLLLEGEVIQDGDQYLSSVTDSWQDCGGMVGMEMDAEGDDVIVRRRLLPATKESGQ